MKSRNALLLSLSFAPLMSMAQSDSTTIDTTMILKEVRVTGARVINKVDRQLIMPTKAMVRNSSNGYDLLRKLSIPGIEVSTEHQTIKSLRGGGVQIRINDVKAASIDILSLQPDEVVRVEYIENPGVRYSDGTLDAVINYIVKRRYSGYVGGLYTMQALWERFNNSNAYFKFNHKRSEFSLSYRFNYRWYDHQKSDDKSIYYMPDGTERHRDYIGYDNTMTYNDHNLQLGYNLAEPDKYNFNARFNLGWMNQPYKGPIQKVVETGKPDLLLYNRNHSNDIRPSLDLYYSLNMPRRQTLAVNVVGTYIDTDYGHTQKEYLFHNSLEETIATKAQNDYSYNTKGNKYSLISEAIYTKQWNKIGLSAGANYNLSRTDNDYVGSVNTDAVLNTNNIYAFAQVQGKLGPINYQAGMGASYVSIKQAADGFTKWVVRPQLTLSNNSIRNLYFRYTMRISPRTPSLSQLSDVRQQSSTLEANDGNTSLTTTYSYSNSLSIGWNHPWFYFNVYGAWYQWPNAIMTSIMPQKQADGSYLFVWKPENQRRYTEWYGSASITVHAIKNVLDLTAQANYTHDESRGLAYSHNFNDWNYYLSASLMLNRWNVEASFAPASKSFFGESVDGGENQSNVSVAYRHKNLRISLGCILVGYAKGYDYTSETNSKYYYSSGHTRIKNNGNMAYLSFSYNFSHGRKYKSEQRKLENSDRDSGIR